MRALFKENRDWDWGTVNEDDRSGKLAAMIEANNTLLRHSGFVVGAMIILELTKNQQADFLHNK